jgi:hypothetical protein
MAANPLASSKVPKIIGLGCLAVIGLLLVVAVLIWINLDSLRETEWFQDASEMTADLGELVALRTALLAEYPAEDMQVTIHSGFGQDSSRAILVQLINPRFDPADAEGGEEATARQIALAVADRFSSIEEYGGVAVSFISRKGFSIKIQSIDTHSFETADLLAELRGSAAAAGETGAESDAAPSADAQSL